MDNRENLNDNIVFVFQPAEEDTGGAEQLMKTGIFTNKDFSTIWIKDITGNIRTFSTQEVIELDEKDKKILELEKQIENMKGMMLNAKSDNVNVNEPTTIKKSSRVSNGKSNDE